MSLLATTLYLTAALAAGISDEDIPLEALEPSPEDAVVSVPDPADDEPADEEVPEAGSRDAVRAPDLGTPAGTDWHETGPRS